MREEIELCDWLLPNEEVSRFMGDCGGVIKLGLLLSEPLSEPVVNRGYLVLEGIRILPLLLGAKARLLDEPAIRALAGRDCVPCGVVLLEDLDKSLEWLWSGPVRSRL